MSVRYLAFGILFALFLSAEANFRGGSLTWRRTGPYTVEFTIVTAWTSAFRSSPTVNLGDGTTDQGDLTKETTILESTDKRNINFVVQRRTIVKTYPVNGPLQYTAFTSGLPARPIHSSIGANTQYRLEAKVDLTQTASPQVNLIPIIQSYGGLTNWEYQVPVLDPTGTVGAVNCRLATQAESLTPVASSGGNDIAISSSCLLQWNTASTSDNQHYPVQIIASKGNASIALEFQVEIARVTAQPPSCSFANPSLNLKACDVTNNPLSIADPDSTTLGYRAFGFIPGSIITPSSPTNTLTTINLPITAAWDYTPTPAAAGSYAISTVYVRDSTSLTAQCPLSVTVRDLNCNDLLEVVDTCTTSGQDKVFELGAMGDIEVEWTTTCQGGVFANRLAADTELTLPSFNFRAQCTISVLMVDSCFGTRTCQRTVERGCCPEGYDACGQCGGDNSTCLDCEGVANGGKIYDDCGVCGGDGETCCNNYMRVPKALWDYILIPEAVADVIERIENLYALMDWTHHNLPEPEDLPERITCEVIGTMAEINRMFLFDCGLNQFCTEAGSFLTSLQHANGKYII